jgi:hypothetical protein
MQQRSLATSTDIKENQCKHHYTQRCCRRHMLPLQAATYGKKCESIICTIIKPPKMTCLERSLFGINIRLKGFAFNPMTLKMMML